MQLFPSGVTLCPRGQLKWLVKSDRDRYMIGVSKLEKNFSEVNKHDMIVKALVQKICQKFQARKIPCKVDEV